MAMATATTPAGSTSQRSITVAAAVAAAAAAVERYSQQDNGQVRKHAKQVWLGVLLLHAAMHGVEVV